MTFTIKPVFIALLGGIVIGGLLVGFAFFLMNGGDEEPQLDTRAAQVDEAPTPAPTATSVPPTHAPSPSVPASTQTPEPRVRSCGEIRATGYESDAERSFFLSSCFSSQQATGPTATPRPANTPAPPAAVAPIGPSEQEVAYRREAQSTVTAFTVRLEQFIAYFDTADFVANPASAANFLLEFSSQVRTFAYEVSINQPVPPRFRQAHDRMIASATALADHLRTSDSIKPAEALQWSDRFSVLGDRFLEDLANYINVVGLK